MVESGSDKVRLGRFDEGFINFIQKNFRNSENLVRIRDHLLLGSRAPVPVGWREIDVHFVDRRRRTRSPRAGGCRGTAACCARRGAGTRPRQGWPRKRPFPAKRARRRGRLEQGVGQAALVPAANEKSACFQRLQDQGFRRPGTPHPGAGKGILHGRRPARQADDEPGIRSGRGGGLDGFSAGAEGAAQLLQGPAGRRGNLGIDNEGHAFCFRPARPSHGHRAFSSSSAQKRAKGTTSMPSSVCRDGPSG